MKTLTVIRPIWPLDWVPINWGSSVYLSRSVSDVFELQLTKIIFSIRISLDKCTFHNELYDVNAVWSPLACVICQCREILENQTVTSVCYIKQCPILKNCRGVWIIKVQWLFFLLQ